MAVFIHLSILQLLKDTVPSLTFLGTEQHAKSYYACHPQQNLFIVNNNSKDKVRSFSCGYTAPPTPPQTGNPIHTGRDELYRDSKGPRVLHSGLDSVKRSQGPGEVLTIEPSQLILNPPPIDGSTGLLCPSLCSGCVVVALRRMPRRHARLQPVPALLPPAELPAATGGRNLCKMPSSNPACKT